MKKIILSSALALTCVLSSFASNINNKVVPSIYQDIDKVAMNQWVDSVYNTMSMNERIGQLFIVVAHGTNTAANKKTIEGLVRNNHLGGILFSKGTPENQAALTNAAQEAAKIPLMVTLDGEWGLSMRLSNTTVFPRNMTLGAIQNDSLIYLYGQEVARQCQLMGIHVNFAPDIDVNSNPDNPVIGNRSFGENPRQVARLGIMYSKGLESGNVMAVSKHFPGHGDTSTDSHFTLPHIDHDKARLDSVELYPFREYINAGLSGVMVAHLNIPALDDKKQPSSLSKPIVTDLLQKKLGFSGLVFTDGLQMKGVSVEEKHCVRALLAGNDILLGPTYLNREYESVKDAVENGTIPESLINEKAKKVLAYKYILNAHKSQPIETVGLSRRLNTSHAEWLNRQLYKNAITLLKDESDLIPLEKLDKQKIAVVSVGASAGSKFATTLKKYGNVASYSVADNTGLLNLKKTLASYTTIIFAIHNNKVNINSAIESVGKDKQVLLTFFTSPYRMSTYATSIKNSDVVIAAYENNDMSQEYAAQSIFGGIETNGKLPVSVSGVFEEGTGFSKKKTRLGYSIPEEAGIHYSLADSIRKIVKEGLDDRAFPGAQVLVARNGLVIFDEAFGSFTYGGNRKVEEDDIYDLASMTKATATVPAIMKLYDEKKISTNDELSKYVPALKDTDKEHISLRDALYHESRITSFIPYYMGAIDPGSYAGRLFGPRESYPFTAQLDAGTWARIDYKFKSEVISKTPKEGYLPMADGMFVNKEYKEALLEEIANSTLRKRKSYLYSCLNFMLLKEVVEKQADTDLNTYVQNNFFKKLGSTTTTYNPLTKFDKSRIVPTEQDDFLRKGLVQGYVHDEGAALMGGISGNAGLFSNANDIAKLYQMLLNGGTYGGERYLSEKTVRFFTSSKSSISRRGLGFDKPEPSVSKSSPTSISTPVNTYGHTGFTGTSFWIDPDNNLIYIFLSNRVYPNRSNKKLMTLNIRTRIQEEIYNAIKLAKNGAE